MAGIFIACPTTGVTVPTGQHASTALMKQTLAAGGSFRCPSCNQVHAWTSADATVGLTKAHLRSDGTISTMRD